MDHRKCHLCGSQLHDNQPARKPVWWAWAFVGHCGMLWLLPYLNSEVPFVQNMLVAGWWAELVWASVTAAMFFVALSIQRYGIPRGEEK